MIDHNHFICHFIFGGHLLNIPVLSYYLGDVYFRRAKVSLMRRIDSTMFSSEVA